jgi:hypothetical protein
MGANRPKPTGPQNFMFVGLNQSGLISASGTDFIGDASTPPNVRTNDFRELVGKNPGEFFLYETGIYGAFPSDDQLIKWINANGAPERSEGKLLAWVTFGDSCIRSSNEVMTRKSPTDKLLAPKNGVHSRVEVSLAAIHDLDQLLLSGTNTRCTS